MDCVEALLAAGADMALRFMQLTPLAIAQQMGNMDMTRCLERAAADRMRDGLTTASSRSSYASASTQARARDLEVRLEFMKLEEVRDRHEGSKQKVRTRASRSHSPSWYNPRHGV